MTDDSNKQQDQKKYDFFAFISYSSKDKAWGKRIQKKLESYRMPVTLCSEHGWERKPMNPIFVDKTDIQPGPLNAELQKRLAASRHLIVICSPNSAKSEWVGQEIAYFHSLGRTDNIHFFIIDGVPHSGNKEAECFNPIIEAIGLPEILGANIHEKVYRWPWLNKERAYVQLITKLLGVEFDSIWQRHKRLLIEKCAAWTLGIVAVLATLLGVWVNSQPLNVSVRFNETSVHNGHLPPLHDAVISISIDNETKTDTVATIDDLARFANIPHSAIGKEAHVTVRCENWLTTDTTITLTEDFTLNLARDPHPYGDIQFLIWDPIQEKAHAGVKASIKGISGISDSNGRVFLTIPLDKQDIQYTVTCEMPLMDSILCGFPTQSSTALRIKE